MSVFWQLTREKSLIPKCSEIRGNSSEISKGIFQNDIRKFESCRPRQADWSPPATASGRERAAPVASAPIPIAPKPKSCGGTCGSQTPIAISLEAAAKVGSGSIAARERDEALIDPKSVRPLHIDEVNIWQSCSLSGAIMAAHQARAGGTTGGEASWCRMSTSSACAGESRSLKASIGLASVRRLSRVSRRMR